MAGASSATGPLALGALGAVGLLNDSNANEWLVVWDFSITALPNPIPNHLIVADCVIGTGRNAGSLIIVGDNKPAISQGRSMPGSVWTLNVPSNEIAKPFNSVTLLTTGTYAFYLWNHDWPLCAIAPGDSLVAYSDADAYQDFAANFIYQVTTSAP